MRDIKFRALDAANNELYQVKTLTWDRSNSLALGQDNIMQYTGLKDKNGVEIYEGDIVRFYCRDHEASVNKYDMHPMRWTWIIEVVLGCVGYRPLLPRLVHKEDLNWKCIFNNEEGEFQDFSDTEVIGNIYENPELLEDKE